MADAAERGPVGETPIERALRLEAATTSHPREVAVEAEALAVEAERNGELLAASIARRVLGLVCRDSGDLASAASALRAAIRLARDAGDPALEGRARTSLVGLHIVAGDLSAARLEAARAASLVAPLDRARLEMQVAVAEMRAGSLGDAIARYDAAEPVLASAGDDVWLSRLRVNRSVALAQVGRLDDASRDLELGAPTFERGDNAAAVTIALNRAWLAGLAADVPLALRRYDEAAALAATVGVDAGLVQRDRADVLAKVGLWHEAVAAAASAVGELTAAHPVDAPEARIVLADALSGTGSFAEALEVASQAEREFEQQGRAVWVARAAMTRIGAALAVGSTELASLVEDATAAAAALADAGFAAEATEARALAVRACVDAGLPVAARLLPLVPPSGPPWTRLRAWHAEALRRLVAGDAGGAARAVSAALDAVDPFREALGSLELRAGVGASVASVADLGVALAARRGPRALLVWAERRAGTTGLRPHDPGDDVRVALAAMRAAALEAATGEGGPEAAVIARRLRGAEAEVRRIDRHGRSGSTGERARGADVRGLDRLGDRTLLRYVVSGSDLWVVDVTGRRAVRRHLGPLSVAVAAVDRVRFAVARSAAGGPAAERGRAALAGAVAGLERLLVPRRLGLQPVLVVPDGPLHGVPWRALRSLVDREVTVAPSVTAWSAATDRLRAVRGKANRMAVFVAGPDLPGAEDEVRAAARTWGPGSRVLGPTEANVREVLDALGTARLAHLACHGRFRGDSPLFSALSLRDGPLTVHDMLGLRQVPEIVVLGACDVGVSVAVAGAEVLGLVAGCLTAGAATVVASVLPLPDRAAAPVLVELVGRIADGAGTASALAESAAAAHQSDDPTTRAVAMSLCCFGAG